MFRPMKKGKEKSDKNAVAELTREWLYKENKWLWEENKKLKETIKDHQFYEEKLEHRIIELEELLHWE